MKIYFNNRIAILVAVVLGLCSSSCEKYLDQGPIDSTYGEVFWTSEAAVEEASNAMYGQLRAGLRSGNSHFILGDFTTGAYNTTEWNLNVKASTSPPYNFSYVPYREGDLQNWSRFYRVIAQANLILREVPNMPASLFKDEARRKAYIADALFVRAFTYFYMTRIWGDPVYVTETFDDVDYGNIPPIPRTEEGKVLDSCLRDLRLASAAMEFGNGDPTMTLKGNKGSAYALMAHIHAWKHNYDSTHYYAQQLIDNGGYSLEPMSTYTNIWKGQASAESIFELPMQYNSADPYDPGQNASAEANFNFFATWLKGTIVDNRKSTTWIAPDNGLLDQIFDKTNDKRYSAVWVNMPASGGDVKGNMLLKYTNFNYLKPDTKSGAYINNNLVIFRLSDIYLLNAEALAFKNNLDGAKQNLAMTEGRAGIQSYSTITSQYDMIDEVVMERGRELAGEGHWFYDMIRTNEAQGWLQYIGYPNDRVSPANKGYYWPLDMASLFPQNTLLTQNPWWATHK